MQFFGFLFAVSIGSSQAATISVCPSGCSYDNPVNAVAAASNGDRVEIYAGTYSSSNKITVEDDNLTIIGMDGSASTTIQSTDHVFEIQDDVTGTHIEGLTLDPDTNKAGLHIQKRTDSTLIDLVISNQDEHEAIKVNDDSTLLLQNSTFENNERSGDAPTLQLKSRTTVTVENCTFTGNESTSYYGAAIDGKDMVTLTVTDSTGTARRS